jgi:hypothetical protein
MTLELFVLVRLGPLSPAVDNLCHTIATNATTKKESHKKQKSTKQ